MVFDENIMSGLNAMPWSSIDKNPSEDAAKVIKLSSLSNTIALGCTMLLISVLSFYLNTVPVNASVKTLSTVAVFGVITIYPIRLVLTNIQWIFRISFAVLLLSIWSWTLSDVGSDGSEFGVLIVILSALIAAI